ncbi:cysteine hydrolase family protein [Hyperthermus butylicus]|uniref:IIsochorismatase family protein n=1 Tax=Hyperthermus butylicus (strain DSM 5456 / JCM 9403 / PLM1-5) TaxID=415426 RepID=A2BIX9_HYPBU|nr:isochorismatase family cysteine hydrolase [Hyperthermus butylicus]ABM79940.1 iIsochorismatase family protein [Hyperthermus butylicus DSM 5456]
MIINKKVVEVPEIPVEQTVRLSADRTAVIVVDMQNDFVRPEGKLFVPTAPKTIQAIRELLEKARRHAVMTIYTMDTHYSDDPEFRIWGEHVVKGSWGWQIVDELKPTRNEIVVEKTRYDGFYGTPIDDLLRVHGIENVVIVGTVANICVLHTAASAALRWYKVYVPMDGISALNEFDYYLTLRQITFLYRGVVVESVKGIEFEGQGKWPR